MSGRSIEVKVVPGARIAQVISELSLDGTTRYRVTVPAPPEDGKANQAVLKLLAKHFGLAVTDLEIIKGRTSRNKIIRLP